MWSLWASWATNMDHKKSVGHLWSLWTNSKKSVDPFVVFCGPIQISMYACMHECMDEWMESGYLSVSFGSTEILHLCPLAASGIHNTSLHILSPNLRYLQKFKYGMRSYWCKFQRLQLYSTWTNQIHKFWAL